MKSKPDRRPVGCESTDVQGSRPSSAYTHAIMSARRVGVVFGTRPEAVKVAPLLVGGASDGVVYQAVLTGQHEAMVREVNEVFGVVPVADLAAHSPGQALGHLAATVIDRLSTHLEADRPDAVLVQGDTTSAFVAALAAFYLRIPVIHLEAGLRTRDLSSPFPEEGNRRGIGQLARLHLAPTPLARDNLLRENVDPSWVAVTGNTVIDALHLAVNAPRPDLPAAVATVLASGRRFVLVTTHRRESWGGGIERISRAVRRVAESLPDVDHIVPMHANPAVREQLRRQLEGCANVVLTEPIGYGEFVHVLSACHIVLTDSGGLQEEAPALGKPVLVVRDTTERPEAVTAGTARLVGTDEDAIVSGVSQLLVDDSAHRSMAVAVNPYGDGRAAARCRAAVAELLGVGSRLPDFVP